MASPLERADIFTARRGASGEATVVAPDARRPVRLARTNAGFESLHRDCRKKYWGCQKTGGTPCKRAREGALPSFSTNTPSK